MSFQASIHSPLPKYGLGMMPGSKDVSTYSTSYQRRTGSAIRKYSNIGGSASMYGSSSLSSSSRPNPRPLPTGPGSLRGPLRADHSYSTHSKFDYTPSVGTLRRTYSPVSSALKSTTKDVGNRSIRSRCVSNADRLSENLSDLNLNGAESAEASPRTNDLDDSFYASRESQVDLHEQNLNDTNIRVGSRISRLSNGSISDDDIFTPRNRDSTGRATSIQRDNDNIRKESIKDIETTKSLSRQSSNRFISTTTNLPKIPMCVICEDRYSDSFLPCGHILCLVCACELEERNKLCHICRKPFSTVHKLFY